MTTESDNSTQLIQDGPAFARAGLVHRVLIPDTVGPRPTAVLLHGRSGNEDVMWVFTQTLPKDWLIIAPRAIKPDPDGGYSWLALGRDEWPPLSKFEEAVTAVTHFIHVLPQLYNADPGSIYLMGFSQGAATAYATAMRQPGLVRGIAGLVGFVPVECDAALETNPLKGLPIFMAVGKEDPRIPWARAQACAQTLRAAGAKVAYHEYDTGHKVNAQGMRDLKQWWRERKKEQSM